MFSFARALILILGGSLIGPVSWANHIYRLSDPIAGERTISHSAARDFYQRLMTSGKLEIEKDHKIDSEGLRVLFKGAPLTRFLNDLPFENIDSEYRKELGKELNGDVYEKLLKLAWFTTNARHHLLELHAPNVFITVLDEELARRTHELLSAQLEQIEYKTMVQSLERLADEMRGPRSVSRRELSSDQEIFQFFNPGDSILDSSLLASMGAAGNRLAAQNEMTESWGAAAHALSLGIVRAMKSLWSEHIEEVMEFAAEFTADQGATYDDVIRIQSSTNSAKRAYRSLAGVVTMLLSAGFVFDQTQSLPPFDAEAEWVGPVLDAVLVAAGGGIGALLGYSFIGPIYPRFVHGVAMDQASERWAKYEDRPPNVLRNQDRLERMLDLVQRRISPEACMEALIGTDAVDGTSGTELVELIQ